MNKSVPYRQQNTYQQTFYFDQKPQEKITKINKNCFLGCRDIIKHDIKQIHTKEQIQHKAKFSKNVTVLQIPAKSGQLEEITFGPQLPVVSKNRKQQDLRGQLQTNGIEQFNKPNYSPQKLEQLVATNCSFLHTDYDSPSKQNQFAKYNRCKISKQLKEKYDLNNAFGCRNERLGRVFYFSEK